MDDSSVLLVKGSDTVLVYDHKDPLTGYYQPETRDRNSLKRNLDGDWVETQPDGFQLYYRLLGSSSSSGSGSASTSQSSASSNSSASAAASTSSAIQSGSGSMSSPPPPPPSTSGFQTASGGSASGSIPFSPPPPPPPPPPPTTSGFQASSGSSSSGSSSSSGASGRSGSGSSIGGGGSVSVPCCPNTVPTTLYLTINSPCSCLNGTYPLTWSGSYWYYNADATNCPNTATSNVTLRLSCSGADCTGWSLEYSCGGSHPVTASPQPGCTCDPMHVVFQWVDNGQVQPGKSQCCPNQTVTGTLTE